jgi:pimeloyl-ACP methyl ester carboxylesterase
MKFLLVHGAFQGGWCWIRVRQILQQAGHEVFTPSLTGLGERKHLLSAEVGLEIHIQDIVNLLEFEDLRDVVLAGHSYGGMVITGACDLAADRIRDLVFIDALMPRDGECNLDILDPPIASAIRELAVDGWRVSPPPEVLLAYLGIENSGDRAWVAERLLAQSLHTFEQPFRASSGKAERIRKAYLRSTKPSSGPAYEKLARRAKSEGWAYYELPTAHEAMLTMPLELARILKEVGGQSPARGL